MVNSLKPAKVANAYLLQLANTFTVTGICSFVNQASLSVSLALSLTLSSTKYNLDDFCSAVCSVATRLPHSELEHAVNFLS